MGRGPGRATPRRARYIASGLASRFPDGHKFRRGQNRNHRRRSLGDGLGGCRGAGRTAGRPVGDGRRGDRVGQYGSRQYGLSARRDPAQDGVRATSSLAEAGDAEAVLLVAPAQHLRAVCGKAPASRPAPHAGRDLRQGHRAEVAQAHERGGGGSPAAGVGRGSLRPDLRARGGERRADRGDARGQGRGWSASRSSKRSASAPSGPISRRM